jgi:hypothetical protein
VEVENLYGLERTKKLSGLDLTIDKSKDFAWQQGFEAVEVISFALATIVAVATGLATFYFKNPSFGSFQDYISVPVGYGCRSNEERSSDSAKLFSFSHHVLLTHLLFTFWCEARSVLDEPLGLSPVFEVVRQVFFSRSRSRRLRSLRTPAVAGNIPSCAWLLLALYL